jgi:hypothetical protein
MHIATCFPRVVKLLVVLVTLALSVTVPAFGAILKASPTNVSYASTPVNGSSTQSVTLTDVAQISWVGITGSQTSSFPVVWNYCALNLSSGKSITFIVKFVPKNSGNFSATLTVFSATAARVDVPHSGSASPGGGL